jgi:hypothetical protein
MRTRHIRARLKKLEARLPRRPAEQDRKIAFLCWLLILATAYYLGDPQPNEPINHAHGRALGVEEAGSLLTSYAQAHDRLGAKFGVSRNDGWDRRIDAFNRMAAGFSDRYKEALEERAREYGIKWPLAWRGHRNPLPELA